MFILQIVCEHMLVGAAVQLCFGTALHDVVLLRVKRKLDLIIWLVDVFCVWKEHTDFCDDPSKYTSKPAERKGTAAGRESL